MLPDDTQRKVDLVWALCLGILLSGFWGCQGKTNHPDQMATVQGCISNQNGTYELTDNSGNRYVLTGNTSQVKENVGHEMLIRGTEVENSKTPQAFPEAKKIHSQIEVSSAKVAGHSCGSAQK